MTAFKLVRTGEISRETQSSLEICGVIERMVPTVIEVTRLCCRAVWPFRPGRKLVLELKKGTSSPTLMSAVWLLSVRRRGVEMTWTVPCSFNALTAACVLKFWKTREERLPPEAVEEELPTTPKRLMPPIDESRSWAPPVATGRVAPPKPSVPP